VFGDDVDTDQMMPTRVLFSDVATQAAACFAGLRPGWAASVRQGDVLIGGRNFGLGSSRPAPVPLRHLGIVCVLAESLAGLFFRNCVSYGLPAFECPGIADVRDGATVTIDIEAGLVRSSTRVWRLRPVPAELLALMQGGGILPLLEREGLISPPLRTP
jgi:3-isopropylmalate/(R)-2-methylmalate dehydratase small subunit